MIACQLTLVFIIWMQTITPAFEGNRSQHLQAKAESAQILFRIQTDKAWRGEQAKHSLAALAAKDEKWTAARGLALVLAEL